MNGFFNNELHSLPVASPAVISRGLVMMMMIMIRLVKANLYLLVSDNLHPFSLIKSKIF